MEMVCLMTPSCHFPVRERKRESGREGGRREGMEGGREGGRREGCRKGEREEERKGESICIAQKSKFNLATHDKTVHLHVHMHTW